LTVKRGRILDEALNAELIPPPAQIMSIKGSSVSIIKTVGIGTKECQASKDEIEELIEGKPRYEVLPSQRRTRKAKTFTSKVAK